MYTDDNLDQVDYIKWRQISKSLFTLIIPQMSSQLIQAEGPENLDKLLDSSKISYWDSKSQTI